LTEQLKTAEFFAGPAADRSDKQIIGAECNNAWWEKIRFDVRPRAAHANGVLS
jgi:hypothetical protein